MEDFPAHIWPQTQQLFQSTSAYCPKLENPALCSNQLYLMKSRYFSMWWCVRSVASDSAALWTVACQALCPWDSPARRLEWFTISYSRGSNSHLLHLSFLPALVIYCLSDNSLCNGWRWYLIVGLICISQMISDVEVMLSIFSCVCWPLW